MRDDLDDDRYMPCSAVWEEINEAQDTLEELELKIADQRKNAEEALRLLMDHKRTLDDLERGVREHREVINSAQKEYDDNAKTLIEYRKKMMEALNTLHRTNNLEIY